MLRESFDIGRVTAVAMHANSVRSRILWKMSDLVARTDAPVRELFERIAGPAAAAAPDLNAIGAALVELAMDVDYLATGRHRVLEPGDGGRMLASQPMPDA